MWLNPLSHRATILHAIVVEVLNGQCKNKSIVYKAEKTPTSTASYLGLAANTFKERSNILVHS